MPNFREPFPKGVDPASEYPMLLPAEMNLSQLCGRPLTDFFERPHPNKVVEVAGLLLARKAEWRARIERSLTSSFWILSADEDYRRYVASPEGNLAERFDLKPEHLPYGLRKTVIEKLREYRTFYPFDTSFGLLLDKPGLPLIPGENEIRYTREPLRSGFAAEHLIGNEQIAGSPDTQYIVSDFDERLSVSWKLKVDPEGLRVIRTQEHDGEPEFEVWNFEEGAVWVSVEDALKTVKGYAWLSDDWDGFRTWGFLSDDLMGRLRRGAIPSIGAIHEWLQGLYRGRHQLN